MSWGVQLLATCWMVLDSKLWLGKRFSLLDTHPERPWGPFSLLYKGNCGCYQGMKRLELGFDHPSLACSMVNTLRTGDADLRFYVTTVQDG